MRKIENYWCDDKPTLEDIRNAYARVLTNDVVVKIEWFVRFNGAHSRIITDQVIKDVPDYEEYFRTCIPHCYGV